MSALPHRVITLDRVEFRKRLRACVAVQRGSGDAVVAWCAERIAREMDPDPEPDRHGDVVEVQLWPPAMMPEEV